MRCMLETYFACIDERERERANDNDCLLIAFVVLFLLTQLIDAAHLSTRPFSFLSFYLRVNVY